MQHAATDKRHLLAVAEATLETLGNGDFARVLAESSTDEAPQPSTASGDMAANALAAALDWARLEDDLKVAGPESAAALPADIPYIPSNQALALLQSAYEEYLEESERGFTEAPFDPTDPGWVTVAWERLQALFRGKRRFIRHTSAASFRQELPEDAVVALYSDWGTGEETARRVIQQIRRINPTHAIHLGDVYYSGTKREITKRFLEPLAQHGPPAGCKHFALNSNHEMYSGGHAYFDTTLKRFGQEASYFNLRNPHWQLIGLDSGYEDHGLQDPQAEWLSAQLDGGGRKAILLSHHQLFSPYESRAFDRQLHKKVTPLLPLVHAWFWGHEHRCIVFGKHMGIKARCVGHGAIPEEVPYGPPRFPAIPVEQIDERAAPGTASENIHGFAILRFSGPDLDVAYLDEFGGEFFSERL